MANIMDISSILQDGKIFDWRNFHFDEDSRMNSKRDNSPMALPSVALRLEALRNATSLGKGEFADSVNIDRSSYSKIIKAEKPLKIEMGFSITERWGVSLDYLYRGRLSDLPEKYARSIANFLNAAQE